MSIKSAITNITSSINKYGKSIKATVNRMSYPKPKFLSILFTSRLFLYFIVFVTIVVIFTYVNTRDITSVVSLLLIGFLTSFFTKNMSVILLIALSFTMIFKYGMKLRHEGFEGKEEEDEEEKKGKENMEGKDKETKEEKDNEEKDKKKKDNIVEEDKKENMENKEKDLTQLKKDYESFEEIQQNILGGVKKINKELDKAETFITKYEKFKQKHDA